MTAALRVRESLLAALQLLAAPAELVRAHAGELLFGAALLGGWALVLVGLAAWLGPATYPLGWGLFLLACCGFRVLRTLAVHGLYTLSKGDAP